MVPGIQLQNMQDDLSLTKFLWHITAVMTISPFANKHAAQNMAKIFRWFAPPQLQKTLKYQDMEKWERENGMIVKTPQYLYLKRNFYLSILRLGQILMRAMEFHFKPQTWANRGLQKQNSWKKTHFVVLVQYKHHCNYAKSRKIRSCPLPSASRAANCVVQQSIMDR